MNKHIIITQAGCRKFKRQHTREMITRNNPSLYQKYFAADKETGKRTTAITLSRGRVAIGQDVWRMSNKADMCEYPYKILSKEEFFMFYTREEPTNFLSPIMEDEVETIVNAV